MKFSRDAIAKLATDSVYFLNGNVFADFQFVIDDITRPWYFVSDETLVLKLQRKNGEIFAAKVLFNRSRRYADHYHSINVQQTEQSQDLLPEITYVPNGFGWKEGDKKLWAPLLLMPWKTGHSLYEEVSRLCKNHDKDGLEALYYKLRHFLRQLLFSPFVHGQLNARNIQICDDGNLSLLDFDQAWLPKMPAIKTWKENSFYEHPKKTRKLVEADADDFPAIVLLSSLYALMHQPAMFSRCPEKTRLLFTADELADLDSSHRLKYLYTLNQPALTYQLMLLQVAALREEGDIDSIEEFLFDTDEDLPGQLKELESLLLDVKLEDRDSRILHLRERIHLLVAELCEVKEENFQMRLQQKTMTAENGRIRRLLTWYKRYAGTAAAILLVAAGLFYGITQEYKKHVNRLSTDKLEAEKHIAIEQQRASDAAASARQLNNQIITAETRQKETEQKLQAALKEKNRHKAVQAEPSVTFGPVE